MAAGQPTTLTVPPRWPWRRIVAVLVALGLAGIALLYASFAEDLAKARTLLAGRSEVIETDHGALEFADIGTGDPVLAIHGSGGGFDQGLELAAPLAADHRIIAPSRFGYLRSAYPDEASNAMQADAFADLLDRLGVDRAVILSASAGALSAIEFAIRHPERCRALVLLVPAAYAPTRAPNTSAVEGSASAWLMRTLLSSDLIFWAGGRFFPDAMTTILLATDPALVHAADAAEQARVRMMLDHILPVSARAPGLLYDMKAAGAPSPQALDRISCPVLTISADDDFYGTADPARYIASGVTDGRAIVFPTGGHLLVGRQADAWRGIRLFIDRTKATPEGPTPP